ncbi:hypothetical protein GLOIN_2v1786799 [Rhizophagus irregularis DAOM 181602=DAOM 197198]|uniref:Uncharacterized protein n=1 Tax=Rhizophagus irregularis (strain DAOM 181602 / DAOM 197198 / MUCL 43194) TaxID=747089 RepID=A0A2P4P7C8_RHIID|nr:hypothetical protein GLOIN_2v1786799 [Rhizophagus irregularis DAOM 181602=DAOM 197198]POG61289.1 hypothetical protein GLOIN_2v1786799 [Rhizophagus irregularis DAOM 181602=DAOM 197198]|eukprot:XP_025168155.1 hypothetical protein GLOIN_2v1786799 [Rhizophagus irregularis DAOM 181602=DAOM 197198]
MDDIRILVAIDFETIYSGNVIRPRSEGVSKASTALQYDEGHKKITTVEVYLAQMRKLIQETLKKKGRCPTVKFPQQVDFVLTISAEWPPYTTKVMRECAYKTGFEFTSHNEFTTEPEAAAFHCLSVMRNKTYNLMRIKSPYLFEPFEHQVPIIAAVPTLSMAAIVRGAITYGFNIDIVHDRILKWTHGIEVCRS